MVNTSRTAIFGISGLSSQISSIFFPAKQFNKNDFFDPNKSIELIRSTLILYTTLIKLDGLPYQRSIYNSLHLHSVSNKTFRSNTCHSTPNYLIVLYLDSTDLSSVGNFIALSISACLRIWAVVFALFASNITDRRQSSSTSLLC